MRLLHYLEIQNFKSFGDCQRIELAHPGVLISPNNCGKTTAIQAIALWSQIVNPQETSRGSIEFFYYHDGVKEPLDRNLTTSISQEATEKLDLLLLLFRTTYATEAE